MNLVDLFAILPYFVNFIVDHLSEFHIIGKAGKVVRLVRVTKILRVFKLVRHFAGLQSLFFTIRKAARDDDGASVPPNELVHHSYSVTHPVSRKVLKIMF